MRYETLVTGYKHVMDTIYSPRHYYERVVAFLKEYKPRKTAGISQLRFNHIKGLIKTLWFLGVTDKGRQYFWRLLILTLLRRPRHFALSIGLSVSGFHFRKVVEGYNKSIIAMRHQRA
jgi:hypothetical protein